MPDYILEPIDTDPDVLLDELIDYVQTQYPNWDPASAQLDYLIARFVCLKQAAIADMTSRVMRGIFVYFGETIVNIPPVEALSAEVPTTWNAINDEGYTLTAGTVFGIRDSLGELHDFQVRDEAVISPTQTQVTGVIGTSLSPGTQANNLSGDIELIEPVDWVESALTEAPSSGGTDAESEEEYLNRLTNNLGLMAPRPILAKDYALLARNISGVWRAAAIDNFLPGINEIETISHNYTGNGATGGTITFNGQTTAALAWNSTAAQVQAALEALTGVEVGDVTVTGGPWPAALTFTFKGRFEYTNVTQMTASAGTWTGGTTITITTTTGGAVPNLVADRAIAVAGIDTLGIGISSTIKTALDAYLQSLREQNFIVNILDPAYTTIDITAAVTKKPGADAADVDTRTTAALEDAVRSYNWGLVGFPPDGRAWDNRNVLRHQELLTVVNNVDGVDFASSLTFSNGSGATKDTSDKTLLGTFTLPRPGVIDVTVT